MEDRTGTPVCSKCAEDCLESGLFDLRPSYLARFHRPDYRRLAQIKG